MARYGQGGHGILSNMETKTCPVCATTISKGSLSPEAFRRRVHCSRECAHLAMTERVERTFWDRVTKMPNGCWEWAGARSPTGYGKVRLRREDTTAHRASWTMTYGPIPEGLWVMHLCDNPPCCNPEHLRLGTQLENIEDMFRKGRAKGTPLLRGEAVGTAKLTRPQVVEMRRLHSEGVAQRELARRYRVSRATVRNVVRGIYWRHVA